MATELQVFVFEQVTLNTPPGQVSLIRMTHMWTSTGTPVSVNAALIQVRPGT